MVARELAACIQCAHIGVQQPLLALVLLSKQLLDDVHLDAHQFAERPQHEDVLEQRALARHVVGRVADGRGRHADDVDVRPEGAGRHRLGAVVEQVAARLDLGQVLAPSLRVHRHHQVHAAAPAQPASLADAHLVPGRQALDVAREDVARADRHAHAQDGAREQLVGRGRARAVDVGELDDEVVDGLDAAHWCSPVNEYLDRSSKRVGPCLGRPGASGLMLQPPCAA